MSSSSNDDQINDPATGAAAVSGHADGDNAARSAEPVAKPATGDSRASHTAGKRAAGSDDEEEMDAVDALWNQALRAPLPTRIRAEPLPGSAPAPPPKAPAPRDPSAAPSIDQLWSQATARVPGSSERSSASSSSQPQRRSSESSSSSSSRKKREDPLLLLLGLIGVLLLLGLVLFHPLARERVGGPWTVGGLSAGAVFLIYLQPPVQQVFDNLDKVKKRRERERRRRDREVQLEEQRYLESQRRSRPR